MPFPMMLLDRDDLLLRQLLLHVLGNAQAQDAAFVFGADVLGLDVGAYIEAAAAGAGVALLADVLTVLIGLVLIQALGCGDGHIAVLQLHIDLVLLEAGQVNIQLVGVLGFPHIGLHQIPCVLAVQGILGSGCNHTEGIVKEIIKQVLTKNARQHKSFLQFKCFAGAGDANVGVLLLPDLYLPFLFQEQLYYTTLFSTDKW